MSDEVEVSETAPVEIAPGTETQSEGNPAWNDFLKDVPSSMHGMFRPHLERWDQGVQERINSVHSQYEGYKQYADAKVDPNLINESLQIYDAINQDPRRVYDVLAETYGYAVANKAVEQGQIEAPELTAEHDIPGGQFNPEFDSLKNMTETMAKIILQQEEEKANAVADSELDQQLAEARKKHGDFNEDIVLYSMNAGMNVEDAVKHFLGLKNEILSNHNRPNAPTVISGSGPLPSNAINPASLSNKDTKTLVANMFRAQNQGA